MHYHVSAIDPDDNDDYLDNYTLEKNKERWELWHNWIDEENPVFFSSLEEALIGALNKYRVGHPNAYLTYGAGCPPQAAIEAANTKGGEI